MARDDDAGVAPTELIDSTPELCVTAGELRAAGIPVPEFVPDCAWVPRSSIGYENVRNTTSAEDAAAGLLSVRMELTFAEPFRWVGVEVSIQG